MSEQRMLESQTDEDGVVRRWVALGADGRLVIAGQDISAIDPLDAIAARFSAPGGSAQLERLLADGGVPTRFWSRTGD